MSQLREDVLSRKRGVISRSDSSRCFPSLNYHETTFRQNRTFDKGPPDDRTLVSPYGTQKKPPPPPTKEKKKKKMCNQPYSLERSLTQDLSFINYTLSQVLYTRDFSGEPGHELGTKVSS